MADPEQENELEDVQDDEPQTTLKQGYMTKQGGSVKNWKKRWFVLTDKYLKYYKSEKTQNVAPIGLVFLRSVSKIDRGVDGPNGMIDAFAMVTPERTYVFACQSDREVKAWLDAIKPTVKLTGKTAEVVKSGFLTKQGGSFKSWKRRYFVLRSDKLLYYHKDDKEPLSVGVIDLEKCTEIVCVPNIKVHGATLGPNDGAGSDRGGQPAQPNFNFVHVCRTEGDLTVARTQYNHQFSFDIVTASRTFGLFAPTYADLESWVTTLGGITGLAVSVPTPEELGAVPAPAANADAEGAGDAGAEAATTPVSDANALAPEVQNIELSEAVPPSPRLRLGRSQGSLKEGFLTKQGGTFKTWKKRWFKLRDTSLEYYKEPKDVQAQGAIDLTKVVSVAVSTKKGKPFMFDVATKARVFLISAASEDEMNDWISAIDGVLKTLPPPVDDQAGGEEDAGGDDD